MVFLGMNLSDVVVLKDEWFNTRLKRVVLRDLISFDNSIDLGYLKNILVGIRAIKQEIFNSYKNNTRDYNVKKVALKFKGLAQLVKITEISLISLGDIEKALKEIFALANKERSIKWVA